jgi:hypothetical protein
MICDICGSDVVNVPTRSKGSKLVAGNDNMIFADQQIIEFTIKHAVIARNNDCPPTIPITDERVQESSICLLEDEIFRVSAVVRRGEGQLFNGYIFSSQVGFEFVRSLVD